MDLMKVRSMSVDEWMGADINDIEDAITQECVNMAHSLLEIGKLLKAICDGKKYETRGFSSFKEYMENDMAHDFSFSYTQARKHIRVYERYGGRLAQLNCAKIEVLDILRDIPEEEFQQLNDSGQLEDMTTKEAEELRAQLEAANKQISFLENEAADTAKRFEAMEETLKSELQLSDELRAEIKAMQKDPVPVAIEQPSEEQIKKIKSEAQADAQAQIDKLNKSIKDMKDKHKKELANISEKLGADKAAADERIKELESKLQSTAKSSDAELIEFKFYFGEVQNYLGKFLDCLNKISDEKKKDAFKGAAQKFVAKILEELE